MSKTKTYYDLQREIEELQKKQEEIKEEKARQLGRALLRSRFADKLLTATDKDIRLIVKELEDKYFCDDTELADVTGQSCVIL